MDNSDHIQSDSPINGAQPANAQAYRLAKRIEIAERRANIAAAYREGWTQAKIARELRISTFTVSEDLAALVANWKRQAGIDIAAHIATELEKINRREEIAMESFERSRKPKKIAIASKKSDPLSKELGIETTTSSATLIERDEGDPRFLAIAAKCTDQRMRLLKMGAQEEDKSEKKGAKNFAEYVAQHLREREAKMINVTKPNQLPHATVGPVGNLP